MNSNNITNLANINPTDGTNLNIDSGTLFVDAANDRVGIGTTGPTATLEIQPPDNLTSPFYVQYGNGTNVLQPAIYVENSTGNVGIGTTSPSTLLQVGSGTADRSPTGLYVVGTAEFDGAVSFDGTFTMNSAGAIRDNVNLLFGTGSDTALRYQTHDADANAFTIIMPAGDATNVPVAVFGDTSIKNNDLGFFDGITDPSIAIVSDDATNYTRLTVNNAGLISFHSSSTANILVMEADGNVGIGTTSPTTALDVHGSINTSSPGDIYYDGALTSYSPMIIASADDKPIPVCMKADNGVWVGCMPKFKNGEYKWVCEPNKECDEKLRKLGKID
jgi:hypothetical protein